MHQSDGEDDDDKSEKSGSKNGTTTTNWPSRRLDLDLDPPIKSPGSAGAAPEAQNCWERLQSPVGLGAGLIARDDWTDLRLAECSPRANQHCSFDRKTLSGLIGREQALLKIEMETNVDKAKKQPTHPGKLSLVTIAVALLGRLCIFVSCVTIVQILTTTMVFTPSSLFWVYRPIFVFDVVCIGFIIVHSCINIKQSSQFIRSGDFNWWQRFSLYLVMCVNVVFRALLSSYGVFISQTTLILLKLLGVIEASWSWCMAPLLGLLGTMCCVVAIVDIVLVVFSVAYIVGPETRPKIKRLWSELTKASSAISLLPLFLLLIHLLLAPLLTFVVFLARRLEEAAGLDSTVFAPLLVSQVSYLVFLAITASIRQKAWLFCYHVWRTPSRHA